MRKLNIFERIIAWFKSLFIDEKKEKENSDAIKKEMCKKALESGICPHTCDICAWNTLD